MAKIKSEITNVESSNFYPVLFERYSNNDTTLTLEELKYLYYGHSLQPYFNPNLNLNDDSVRTLRLMLKSSNPEFKRIVDLSEFMLRLNPFSIDALYVAGIANEVLGNKTKMDVYTHKYIKLIQVVMSSGDGKTDATAYKVTMQSDAKSLINALGHTVKENIKKEITSSIYDVYIVETKDEKVLDTLYFDADIYFNYGKNGEK